MTREEEIKQYCADQGFPYGACSSLSSMKAQIATDAIKWADENPNGSLINWLTGEPQESGVYLISTNKDYVDTFFFERTSKTHQEIFKNVVVAWCKLSDIKPYKEEQP